MRSNIWIEYANDYPIKAHQINREVTGYLDVQTRELLEEIHKEIEIFEQQEDQERLSYSTEDKIRELVFRNPSLKEDDLQLCLDVVKKYILPSGIRSPLSEIDMIIAISEIIDSLNPQTAQNIQERFIANWEEISDSKAELDDQLVALHLVLATAIGREDFELFMSLYEQAVSNEILDMDSERVMTHYMEILGEKLTNGTIDTESNLGKSIAAWINFCSRAFSFNNKCTLVSAYSTSEDSALIYSLITEVLDDEQRDFRYFENLENLVAKMSPEDAQRLHNRLRPEVEYFFDLARSVDLTKSGPEEEIIRDEVESAYEKIKIAIETAIILGDEGFLFDAATTGIYKGGAIGRGSNDIIQAARTKAASHLLRTSNEFYLQLIIDDLDGSINEIDEIAAAGIASHQAYYRVTDELRFIMPVINQLMETNPELASEYFTRVTRDFAWMAKNFLVYNEDWGQVVEHNVSLNTDIIRKVMLSNDPDEVKTKLKVAVIENVFILIQTGNMSAAWFYIAALLPFVGNRHLDEGQILGLSKDHLKWIIDLLMPQIDSFGYNPN